MTRKITRKKLRKPDKLQARLLSEEFVDRYRGTDVLNSVMKTWFVSTEEIAQEDGFAMEILYSMSFLDNQGIPHAVLLHIYSGLKDQDEQGMLEVDYQKTMGVL